MKNLIDILVPIPASSKFKDWTALDLSRFNSDTKMWQALIWVTKNVNSDEFSYSFHTNVLYIRDPKQASLLVLSV